MNLGELWNLVSSRGIVCFKLVFLVNSDLSRPIFFLELVFFLLCDASYLKMTLSSSLPEMDEPGGSWSWMLSYVLMGIEIFAFLYLAVCFLRSVEIPKELIFRDFICCKFRLVVLYYCHLLVFCFSWLLLAFFANVMFLHFDLTLSSSPPEMDEPRGSW